MYILCVFAYAFAIFAAFPSPIMEAAFGRLHNGGPAAFGRRPTVVESFMVAGEAASVAKTCRRISKCASNMHIDAYIPHIPSKVHHPNHPILIYKPARVFFRIFQQKVHFLRNKTPRRARSKGATGLFSKKRLTSAFF